VKKGSEALMVWVKETATLPRLMLVNTVPSMCPKASGAILPNCSRTQIRKQQTKKVAGFLGRRSREWPPHLRGGDPGRRVEPGRPHEEDEQGAEGELEGGDGVRQRQRQRAENLQWRKNR